MNVLIHEADHIVPSGNDHYIHTYCPSVRPSPLFKIDQNKQIFSVGRDCELAEWIINDSCLIQFLFILILVLDTAEKENFIKASSQLLES